MDDDVSEQKETSSRVVDWLALPDHLVCHKLVHNMKDFIRFGAVCHTWQTIYKENLHRLPRQPPLLILGKLFFIDPSPTLYDVSDNKFHHYTLPVPYDNMLCCGSSYGWLATLCEENDDIITLLNPFLSVNNKIQIPPIPGSSFAYCYLRKVVLSANPFLNPDYTVFAIHGALSLLVFWKPGDKAWTKVGMQYTLISDVIYCTDELYYFVDRFGATFKCNLNHPQGPEVSSVAPPPSSMCFNSMEERKYLVESLGELLLVERLKRDLVCHSTTGFVVYKLDPIEVKWFEVKSLCGHMLFLGVNTSFSLMASDFPGFKANCIYFTDDDDRGEELREMGVFDLEDGSIEPHCPLESNLITPRPIWIEPTARSC